MVDKPKHEPSASAVEIAQARIKVAADTAKGIRIAEGAVKTGQEMSALNKALAHADKYRQSKQASPTR